MIIRMFGRLTRSLACSCRPSLPTRTTISVTDRAATTAIATATRSPRRVGALVMLSPAHGPRQLRTLGDPPAALGNGSAVFARIASASRLPRPARKHSEGCADGRRGALRRAPDRFFTVFLDERSANEHGHGGRFPGHRSRG